MNQAGYTIIVSSWENDWDNHNTKIVSGLTEEDVKYYVFMLNHFKSTGSSTGKPENFYLQGNRRNPTSGFRDLYLKANELFPNTSDKIDKWEFEIPTIEQCIAYDEYSKLPWDKQEETDVHDLTQDFCCYMQEFLDDVLGNSETYCDFHNYVRAFEKIEIYYFENPPLNKTSEFI